MSSVPCSHQRRRVAPHAARSRAHTSRPLPSPSQASRHLRPCTNHARGGAARAEGDGYKRAPFLEPFVATVATAVLVMAFASPNMLQLFQQQAQAKSPTADGSPFADAKTMSFGVLNGRIQACPGAVNPNCISTSSTNEMYSPAWRADAGTSKAALLDLDAAVLGRQDGAIKVLEAETPYGWYAAYSVPGKFSKPDVLEFLLKEQGVTDRNWEGDRDGPTVLYRSIAGDVRYLWPIQQPVTDLDTQKKRMRAIRQDLGWSLIGCELLECYEEPEEEGFSVDSLKRQFRLFGSKAAE